MELNKNIFFQSVLSGMLTLVCVTAGTKLTNKEGIYPEMFC